MSSVIKPRTFAIALAFTGISLAAPSADGALLIHYDMEGDAENLANPGTLDGTAVGGATFTGTGPSGFGNAAEFDGNNQAINTGNLALLDGAAAFTVMGWYRRDTDRDDPTNHAVDNILFSNSSNSGNDNFELGTDGNNIEVYLDNNGSGANGGDFTRNFDTTSLGGIVQGQWHHLAVTYADGSGVTVYLDGALVGNNMDWSTLVDVSTGNTASLGYARDVTAKWADLDGGIDDFRLYDEMLSQSQIQQIAGIPEPSTAVLAIVGLLALSRRRR